MICNIYLIKYKVIYIYISGGWPWDFWTIKFRRIFSFKTQGCRFFPQASGLRRWPQGEARKIDEGLTPGTFNGNLVPSRKLTYPHLGKRKIIFKMPFLGGYVSSLEGNLFIDISLLFWWFQPHLKNMSQIGNLPQIGDENKKIFETTS